jgi:hypothetical protein
MTNVSSRAGGFVLAVIALTLLTSSQAFAGPYRSNFVATCDNGRSYPVRARAVSDQGELVTGDLLVGGRGVGGHSAAQVRLVPAGFGYRYAARGLWLDGLRTDADLHFGKHRSVACIVDLG